MGEPLIIQHRVNAIDALRKTPKKYGVEIDIRHDNRNGSLYLNHDPGTGDDFFEYMDVLAEQRNRFVIFNPKEMGVEQRIIDAASERGIEDYFLLDLEFPFIYRASQGGVPGVGKRIAIRYSEAEPLEQALLMKDKFDWLFIDVNTRLPLDREIYRKIEDAGFRTCIVCPSRWKRPEDISRFIQQMKSEGIKIDAVMTKDPYAEQWEKSGVLRPFE
ncbi:MAG: hypothetical protein HYT73_01585 [Candidatus Aenigmarchaeota archaeon]|nr:hypothetical protein [Candidatus Aenigmarchaeota archaeon]